MAGSFWRKVLGTAVLGAAAAGAASGWKWQKRWGTTVAEQVRPMPGDDLVPLTRFQATRAIGIDAPPRKVWPWLAQLGQGRGGFYSYDWLENLVGLDIHSADAIVPEWQNLQQGDPVHLAQPMALEAAIVEPPHVLVLHGTDTASAPMPMQFSWAFVLEPEGPTGSRLVVRERYGWDKLAVGLVIRGVSLISFVMSQKMLRGIKTRAEAAG
ncbi:MAG: hypothetical protein LBR27_00770 [Bifidobacteriaceae bacterium]|jgi:hypothetical protein|nr:hypothetical protein [Bifidobacteriaceae bacterium]